MVNRKREAWRATCSRLRGASSQKALVQRDIRTLRDGRVGSAQYEKWAVSDSIPPEMAPQTSLYKFRRAVPEVWFRIVHVAPDHANGLVEYREQTVEVALGPDGTFGNANTGRLTRRVAADHVLCAVPPPRYAPKPPGPPKQPKVPRVVELLRMAIEWRRQLDTGMIPNQAAIAHRAGITRARVTQILRLLRLPTEIQERILALPPTSKQPAVSERMLRPLVQIEGYDRHWNLQSFHALRNRPKLLGERT